MDHQFFTDQTSNGPSTAADWTGESNVFAVSGEFDGALLALKISLDGGATYQTFRTINSPIVFNVEMAEDAPQQKLICELTGAKANTKISARIGTKAP